MRLVSQTIAVGKCFLSNMNFVRKVIAIEGNQIMFEERGTKPVPLPWHKTAPVSIEQFLSDVTREVPENFDSEATD